jgi:hypothetical protein
MSEDVTLCCARQGICRLCTPRKLTSAASLVRKAETQNNPNTTPSKHSHAMALPNEGNGLQRLTARAVELVERHFS